MKISDKIKKLQKQIEKLAKKSYIAGSNDTNELHEEYCKECHKATHELYSKPQKILDELEELYRAEHPKPYLYLPDKTVFYKWIVEKIKNISE
jgi:hypothetical protein